MIKKEEMQRVSPPAVKITKHESIHVDPKPEHKLPKINPLLNPKPVEPVITETPEFSYTSPMVDEELKVLGNLKANQITLTGHAVQHMAGLKTRGIYFNQCAPSVNNDFSTITSPNTKNDAKYNRIDNMIVITDSELSQSFSISEQGTDNTVTVSAVIFPGSIIPTPADLFYVYDKKDEGTLYLVTEVEPIYDIDDSGWKIQLKKHYDQITPEKLNLKVENYFVFAFENIGTNSAAVIERKVYRVYEELTRTISRVSEEYFDRFFSRDKNVIYLTDTKEIESEELASFKESVKGLISAELMANGKVKIKRRILDPYVTEFIKTAFKDSPLLYKRYSVIPSSPIWIDEDFKDKYKKTIYTAFQKKNKNLLKLPYMLPVLFKRRTQRDIPYDGWYYFEPVDGEASAMAEMYPPNFINRLIANIPYDAKTESADYLKYNMFFSYFHDKDYKPNLNDLKTFSEDVELIPSNELYGIAPLLLYMCVDLKSVIERRIY